MKILLIKPPLNRNMLTFYPTRAEPLELEYLASAVEEHEVEILDMRIDKNLIKKLEDYQPDLVSITPFARKTFNSSLSKTLSRLDEKQRCFCFDKPRVSTQMYILCLLEDYGWKICSPQTRINS